jgi:hypothetical protein
MRRGGAAESGAQTVSFGVISNEKLWGGMETVLREKGGERLRQRWALYSRSRLGEGARFSSSTAESDG